MNSKRILDTHCHLGMYEDPISVVRSASSADVSIIAVTEDPGEFRRLKTRLGTRHNVEVALGLHPLRAAAFTQHDMARFFRLLPQATWIGEVGLDFSAAGIASKRKQLDVFEAVLTEAQPGRHPLTVHSRGAEREVIERLVDAKLPAVLHWYSGALKHVDDALDGGLYFSINPAMLRSKKVDGLLNSLPQDRVLLETDGPYVKTRRRPARPDDLSDAIIGLSKRWKCDSQSTIKCLLANQHHLLETLVSKETSLG